nr:histidine kinase dimerization/phospho-acceptor domain-containing protein [uncultured Arsenicibacter sp.]
MLTDAMLGRVFREYANDMQSFFGILSYETGIPLYVNPAGMAMLQIRSAEAFTAFYPAGFLRKGPFRPYFDEVSTANTVERREECVLHTGQTIWIWLKMIKVAMEGQDLLLLRATDVVYLHELDQQNLPGNHAELSQLTLQRTEALRQSLSDLENVNATLSALLEQERSVNQRKSDFITAVSHEFRNPLAILQTSAMLLPQLDHAPDRRQRHALIIQEQIQYIKTLLENLVSQTLTDPAPISAGMIYQMAKDIKENGKPTA